MCSVHSNYVAAQATTICNNTQNNKQLDFIVECCYAFSMAEIASWMPGAPGPHKSSFWSHEGK